MDRCSLCPGDHLCVPPNGPRTADIMFIGEAPGKEEDKMGKPFIGKTGQEVNDHYLPLAGLRRNEVYVTNAIKCLPSNSGGKIDLNRSKDVELLYACAEGHLYDEIQSVRPTLLVPMGAFACHAIDPAIELELQYNIPILTSWGMAFPMWHPAAGLHEPKKMLQIRTGWYRLGKYLKGKLYIPEDEYPNPEYGVIEVGTSIDRYPNNGGNYEPENCRWATPKEQANNRRKPASSL